MVERKHKHLLQIARSLMFQSCLPKKFWTYSLLMAIFIINRLLTQVLKWQTPFEKLFRHKPDYSLFKTFDSLCYIANTKPHKTKFKSRSHKCIFLGYSPGQKGFKVFDIDTEQIHISRDIEFFESIFPFRHNQSENPYPSLPLFHRTDDDQDVASLQNDIVVDPLHVLPLTETQQDASVTPDITSDSIPLIQVPFPESQSTSENCSESFPHPELPIPVIRHSTRTKSQPSWLQDYITNITATQDLPTAGAISGCKRVLSPHIGYTPPTFPYNASPFLKPSYSALLENVSIAQEPGSYNQASKSEEWIKAMQQEFDALETNQTWELVSLPPNKQAIGSRWVYKIKFHTNGMVDRY